jgi:hypothetical protein
MKRGARSFMEPTVEKDEFGEVVRSGFIPTAKRCIFLWSAKIIQAFFWLQGMEIRLPGTNWIKIYRSHGRKCGLERNEYLG